MKPKSKTWRALLACALCLPASALVAQQSPAPTGAVAEEDEKIIELSPFEVQADEEQGWVATKSLAGSRLKTNLKDIAAPIEVLTKDFMDEFAINSVEEATIYTTNVEGVGDNLETGPGHGIGVGFPPPTRIRGLGNGTLSRDFFAMTINSDNYNLDRITVAAGPNNLLFGTGSPAGVIDTSLKRAQFRDMYNFGVQLDSRGSTRFTVDLNKELIDEVLAIRGAFVSERKEFDYDPNQYDHDRFYATLRFKPWKSTTISLHFEDADVLTSRPSLLLPFDEVSPWYYASTIPGYTHTTDKPAFANPATGAAFPNINNTVFERYDVNPVVVYGPNNAAPGLGIQSFNNTVQIKGPQKLPTVSSLNNEADGWTFIDDTYFPTDANTLGNARKQRVNSRVYDAFITQQITRDLFVEFAAQQETYTSTTAGVFGYTGGAQIEVDPNSFLPDGVTPNPNFGKYYIDGGIFKQRDFVDSKDWRLTASYEYDFQRDGESWWRNILGKQRLGGLISFNERRHVQDELNPRILPDANGNDAVIPGVTLTPRYGANGVETQNWATNNTRGPDFRYYLSDTDLSPTPPHDIFGVASITDANGVVWKMDMENTGLVDEFGQRLGANRTIVQSKTKLDTQQLAYQGFFWDNRIVATYGWRKDTTNTAKVANNANVASRSGLRVLATDTSFQEYDSANEDSGNTTTKGIVVRPFTGWLHLPLHSDITFAYNESDTFQPDATNYDPYGNFYPGATGDGKDISVRLDVFDGKFSLRYTDFENTAGPARAGNVPFNRFRFTMSNVLNRVMVLATGSSNNPLTGYTDGNGFNNLGNGDPYWVTSNQAADGYEVSLDWNVTRNLQLRFNMNNQTVVESNIGTDWWAWMDVEIPKYQALTYPEGGINNPRDLNGNGTIDTWTWNTAWRTDSNQQTIADWYDADVIRGSTGQEIIQSLDGKSNEFVRENRFNINAVYRFTEGRLNGLSVGGAYRYRAAPLVAYGSSVLNGRESLDLDKPFYGSAENLFDLSLNYRGKTDVWGINSYRLGLNVRNLLDETDLYPKMVDVNGSPIRMGRVSEGRTFIFSLSVDI